jgi:hypothetical protein
MSTMTRFAPTVSTVNFDLLGADAINGERPSVGRRLLARAVAGGDVSSKHSQLKLGVLLVLAVILTLVLLMATA